MMRQCYREDEHLPHYADDIRLIPGGYNCPGVFEPGMPRPEDTNHDIAYKLEQWVWDDSELESWQSKLIHEAIDRLRG